MPAPRVLVADDNPLSLHFFADALSACGLDHVTAIDGAVALECARRDAFDVLLLDARMPNLDGAETLAQLRMQAGPSRHATALATTADNDRETHTALLAAGFIEVLVKPIGFGALRAALGRHMRMSSRASASECAIAPLDDQRALAAAGGDADIVRALRGLLARELDALPAEFAAIGLLRNAHALHERLHRLDASAGFCGVPSLLHASTKLRSALNAPAWPDHGIADFLAACARARSMLPGD